jgi:hypothetical protein
VIIQLSFEIVHIYSVQFNWYYKIINWLDHFGWFQVTISYEELIQFCFFKIMMIKCRIIFLWS